MRVWLDPEYPGCGFPCLMSPLGSTLAENTQHQTVATSSRLTAPVLPLSPWHTSPRIPGPIIGGPTQARRPCQLCHMTGSCGISRRVWGLGARRLGTLALPLTSWVASSKPFTFWASVSLTVIRGNDGGCEEAPGPEPGPLMCPRS